jgi:hypothetical protein
MIESGFTKDLLEKSLKLPPHHDDLHRAQNHILSVVQQTTGLAAAADRLGVSELTLKRWIHENAFLRHALGNLPLATE